jgi:hypothetical protein
MWKTGQGQTGEREETPSCPCLAALDDLAARRQLAAAPGRHANAYEQRAMSACATLSALG